LIEKLNGGKRGPFEKIQEVRGAADGRGFLEETPRNPKSCKLEGKKRRIAVDESPADNLA